MRKRVRLLTGAIAVACVVLGTGAAPALARQSVHGPYASFEVCAVSGYQGQQAGQWVSWFCAQNGTTQWWLFTTP